MDLFSFEWSVSSAGYRWHDWWRQLPTRNRAAGLELEPIDADAPLRVYQPLKSETGLFRVFSSLNGTEADLLAFANQYGPLVPTTRRQYHRYSLRRWKQLIAYMRFLVQLWDAARGHDTAFLKRHVVITNGKMQWPKPMSIARFRRMRSDPLEYEFPGPPKDLNLVNAALYLVNIGVALGFEESDQGNRLQMRVNWSPKAGLLLRLHPRDLLTAIWLQFALAVTGDKQYRACDACGKSYEIAPDTARTNKVFCSNRCKVRAYRERKARAVEMRLAGSTPRQIARALDSDVATVSGWIQQGTSHAKNKTRPR